MARFIPNFDFLRSSDESDLDNVELRRRALVEAGVKVVMLFMVCMAILYVFVSTLTDSAITVPKSSQAVLKSINEYSTPYVPWTSESIRVKGAPGGKELRNDAVRSIAVDKKNNKFQISTRGVIADPTIYLSDGTMSGSLGQSEQDAESTWTMLNDVCSNAPALGADLVSPPSRDDFLKAHPKVMTPNGTVFGTRAWVISFRADKTIISKLLLLGFYDKIAPKDSIDGRYVLSLAERDALAAGRIKQDWARLWVLNDKGKTSIAQIDVRFKLDTPRGAKWRLFAVFPPVLAKESPLKNTKFDKPDCSNSVVGEGSEATSTVEKPLAGG